MLPVMGAHCVCEAGGCFLKKFKSGLGSALTSCLA